MTPEGGSSIRYPIDRKEHIFAAGTQEMYFFYNDEKITAAIKTSNEVSKE